MKVNFKAIGKAAKNVARQTGHFINKHKRAIAGITSTAATIGGTVWACKKTLDIAPEILAIRAEREALEDKKEIRANVREEIKTYVKAYAGPAALIAGGQVAHMAVEQKLESEKAALAAGIGVLQSQVKGLTKEHPVKEAKKDENLPKYAIKDASIIGLSPYAVLFDEKHALWNNDPMWRFREMHGAQRACNELMRRRADSHKPMLMNDIYTILSYPNTELGSHAGYFYDPEGHPDADNDISFLFYDAETKQLITDFTKGIERPVWVDFNVDYGYVTNEFLAAN